MEKILKLYSGNNVAFPSDVEQVVATSFTYSAKRMGDAPAISFSFMHHLCLDTMWSDEVYTEFNWERYYLKQIPSSSFDNNDSRYKYTVDMVSERSVLADVYFFDAVTKNVVFSGDIHEFASRINSSLARSKVEYRVVVDSSIKSEQKLISLDKQRVSQALTEIYNTYNLFYLFDGKTIRVLTEEPKIDDIFEYGSDEALISISKNNSNKRIVTRCTGTGSESNIPYYYPNPTPYGEFDILYNGETSNDVTIFNWARFAKCGLSSTFRYEELVVNQGSDKVYTLSDFDTFGDPVQLEPATGIETFGWVGVCDFDINNSFQDFTLELSNSFGSGYALIEIRNHAGTLVWWWDKDTPNNIPRLTYGDYKAYVTFDIGNDAYEAESTARQYGSITLTLKRTHLIESGWVKNGESRFSTLNTYGIRYAGTPSFGDEISFHQENDRRITTSQKLMPSIYREKYGDECFYNAINKTHRDENGKFYVFENEYTEGRPKEDIVEFEDIKPTIVGVKNADGDYIDSFIDFAYDKNDSDEVDENGVYLHPYFFAKLRKFNGLGAFNLFACAIEGQAMTISMTSGNCGACQWEIGVDDNTQQNLVQVDDDGNLLRDENGNVRCGRAGIQKEVAQDKQNDTINNEVWIALKKEYNTFGVVMPNATNNYKPNVNDTFVIINISLPESYILSAEQRLTEAIIKHMYDNNVDKFNFGIKFSRIHLQENPSILSRLSENCAINVKYNDRVFTLHASSFTYKMTDKEALPEISIELSDEISSSQGTIIKAIADVKSDVREVNKKTASSIKNIDSKKADKSTTLAGYGITDALSMDAAKLEFVSIKTDESIDGVKNYVNGIRIGGMLLFYNKSTNSFEFPANLDFIGAKASGPMTIDGLLTVGNGIKSEDYVEGDIGKGFAIEKDADGNTVITTDKLKVRMEAEFEEIVINQISFQLGSTVISLAGCEITSVEEVGDAYRCYYDNKNGQRFSGFEVGDQARCQRYDSQYDSIVKYYWRVVKAVGEDYVDLYIGGVDGNGLPLADGEGIPDAGDHIVHFGSRRNTARQNAIVISSTPSPAIIQYIGISSFTLPSPSTVISPDGNKFSGAVHIGEGSTGIENLKGLPDAVQDVINKMDLDIDTDSLEFGKYNLLRNSGFTGDYLSAQLQGGKGLNDNSQMFSPSLEHWTVSNCVAQASNNSESGFEVAMADGTMLQTLKNKILVGENYVLSFKAKGTSLTFSVGGVSKTIALTDEYTRYVEKFTATTTTNVFSISANATICEVQLERGTVVSAWGHSMWDNQSELAYYQSLQYLASAMKDGSTTILGGLILSQLIALGNYKNGEMTKVTSGINGLYNDDDDVAFWAGGDLEKAILTVQKHRENPLYQPTEEEWSNMAKFVTTHGGDVFMKGYIYALGGLFKGAVSIANGKILLNADGSGAMANGAFSWDTFGRITRYYPERENWIDLRDATTMSHDDGGFFISPLRDIGEDVEPISDDGNNVLVIPTPTLSPYVFCIKGRDGGAPEGYASKPFTTDSQKVLFRVYGKTETFVAHNLNMTALPNQGTITVEYDSTPDDYNNTYYNITLPLTMDASYTSFTDTIEIF